MNSQAVVVTETNKNHNFQINPTNTLSIKNTLPNKKLSTDSAKSVDYSISNPHNISFSTYLPVFNTIPQKTFPITKVKKSEVNTNKIDTQLNNTILNLDTTNDDPKKIFSMQYYSLVQKSFINVLLENINDFMEQIYNNQIITELVLNNLIKLVPTEVSTVKQEYLNNLNEQLTILKKLNTLGLNSCSSLNVNLEEIKTSGLNYLINSQNRGNSENLKSAQFPINSSYPIFNNNPSFNYEKFLNNYPIPFHNEQVKKTDPNNNNSSLNPLTNLQSNQNENDFSINSNLNPSNKIPNANYANNNLLDPLKYYNQLNTNYMNNQCVGYPTYNNNTNYANRQPSNNYSYQNHYNPLQQSFWNQSNSNNFPYLNSSFLHNYNPMNNMNYGQVPNLNHQSQNQSNLSGSNLYNVHSIDKDRLMSNYSFVYNNTPSINNYLHNKSLLDQANCQQSLKQEIINQSATVIQDNNKDSETKKDIEITNVSNF